MEERDRYRIEDVDVTGQTFVLDGKEEVHFIADSVIRDSHITVAVAARGVVITNTRFFGCTLRFKRQLNNFSFCDAYLEGCTLLGRFSGCDFGRRVDDTSDEYDGPPLYYPEAGIVDTDLSAAMLDGCRFINCDLSTLRLPLWPCFTVIDPESKREQALELPWPGRTRVIPSTWEDEPEGTVANSDDAVRTCKKYGGTPEELRAVLEQIPGVIM